MSLIFDIILLELFSSAFTKVSIYLISKNHSSDFEKNNFQTLESRIFMYYDTSVNGNKLQFE